MWFVMVLACSGGEPEAVTSQQTEPTADLRGMPEVEHIAWTEDLGGLLSKGDVALPAEFEGVQPGARGPELEALFDRLNAPGVRERLTRVGEYTVVGGVVRGRPSASFHFILKGSEEELDQVDLNIPRNVALPLVTLAWGEPDKAEIKPEDQSVYRWWDEASVWQAELRSVQESRAVLKFSAREK